MDRPPELTGTARLRALAVLVFGGIVIGFVPILVRLSEAGPAATAAWRLGLALPLLALMAHRTEQGIGAPPKAAMLAGVMFALDLGFWHYGIAYTTVANATVLSNLTPVVVTAFAWIFLRQRPRMLFLAAVALAIAGVTVMAIAKGGTPGRNPPLGDALSASTALWYALYMLAIGAARRHAGASRVMFWSSLAGLPLVLAAAVALGEPLLPSGPTGWAACAGLGLAHVVGQGSIAWGLGRLPTSTASVVVLIQPVVAAVLGFLLFQEALGPVQAAGAVAALGGVVIAQWAARPRPPVQAPSSP